MATKKNLAAIEIRHTQDLVEELIADGRKASTIRNAILPLRLICRRTTGATSPSTPRSTSGFRGSDAGASASPLPPPL